MDLKEAVLSALAEVDNRYRETKTAKKSPSAAEDEHAVHLDVSIPDEPVEKEADASKEEEALFLEKLRERVLVLFEGFQSPNNSHLEAKIDLTVNFLEYLLATLDERLENLKKS